MQRGSKFAHLELHLDQRRRQRVPLWVPGHTPGTIAYLARTPAGPVLMTGDACHTAWGWEHGVEPGTFSADRAKGAESLARLERFVARHPKIEVRLGHQEPALTAR